MVHSEWTSTLLKDCYFILNSKSLHVIFKVLTTNMLWCYKWKHMIP